MKEEKRKIILKASEPEQTNYFGEAVSASPGEAVEVSEKTARVAVESGKFEYAPEQLKEFEKQIAESKGELAAVSIPMRDKMLAAGFETVEDIQNATDEQILAIDGIGEKTLKSIREAIEKGAK